MPKSLRDQSSSFLDFCKEKRIYVTKAPSTKTKGEFCFHLKTVWRKHQSCFLSSENLSGVLSVNTLPETVLRTEKSYSQRNVGGSFSSCLMSNWWGRRLNWCGENETIRRCTIFELILSHAQRKPSLLKVLLNRRENFMSELGTRK